MEELDHLGVDGGVDPGQSPAEVVQLLCKNLLAFLELLQDVWSLKDRQKTQCAVLLSLSHRGVFLHHITGRPRTLSGGNGGPS